MTLAPIPIDKNKIRPIYRELQAYLAQAPKLVHSGDTTHDGNLWRSFNYCIDELSKITEKNWDRFKITDIKFGQSDQYIYVSQYRNKVNGLIERLYGEYFFNENAPFSEAPSTPSTFIMQNQTQSQSMNVQILLDLQSKLDSKLGDYDAKSPERSFIEKLKSALSNFKDINDLIKTIIDYATKFGLTLKQLLEIFS